MATSQIETVNTGADKAKLVSASAVVVAALAAFYLLDKQGPLVQWAVLILGLVVAVALFLTSEAGQHFSLLEQKSILPQTDGYDGFFMALLKRQ